MSRGRRPALSPEDQTKALWLYHHTSMSMAAIGKRFGVSGPTIGRYLDQTARRPAMRTTYTVATMDVPPDVHAFIRKALEDAGYTHAIDSESGLLDLTHIGLRANPELQLTAPAADVEDDAANTLLTSLENWSRAYPTDLFSEPSEDERTWLHTTKPGLMDRIAASMGRHMVGLIARDLARLRLRIAVLEAQKDGAYLERNKVVAALAACFPAGTARTAIEGWSDDWHGCVYVDLPTGQASWHYHDSHALLFAHLPVYPAGWDGHTTDEKYERLTAFARDAWGRNVRRVQHEGYGERVRQETKWGEQNHPDLPAHVMTMDVRPTLMFSLPSADTARAMCETAFKNGVGSYAHIFVEEVCEALDDARDPQKLRAELVQVEAVTVAWIEKIDRDSYERDVLDAAAVVGSTYLPEEP